MGYQPTGRLTTRVPPPPPPRPSCNEVPRPKIYDGHGKQLGREPEPSLKVYTVKQVDISRFLIDAWTVASGAALFLIAYLIVWRV